MIPQFQFKKENQLQYKLRMCGLIHRPSPPSLLKPQGFMLNGTNHILRSSALFGTAACCRWCPKNMLFVYFSI